MSSDGKYVGTGLPKFTKRTLLSRVRKNGGHGYHNVIEWLPILQRYYKRKNGGKTKKTFDALDFVEAWEYAQSFGRTPCLTGATTIFAQMLTEPVAAAIMRNVFGSRRKPPTRGRDLYDYLVGNRYISGRGFSQYADIKKLKRILKNARTKS